MSALIALAARAAASPSIAREGETMARESETIGAREGEIIDQPTSSLDDTELLADLPAAETARSPGDAGATLTEDAFATVTGAADADLVDDARTRREHRSAVASRSRWGALDISVAWRATERAGTRKDEVWLVATWRR